MNRGRKKGKRNFELYHTYETAKTRNRFVLKIKKKKEEKVEKNELPENINGLSSIEKGFQLKERCVKS